LASASATAIPKSRAQIRHAEGKQEGKTCIDCHKGIAHRLPAGTFESAQRNGPR